MSKGYFRLLVGLLLTVSSAVAQERSNPGSNPSGEPGAMPQMDMGEVHAATSFLLMQSTGTSQQPEAWPMPMAMSPVRSWRLMWMGQGFLAATQQSGPRGKDKIYSLNWGMLSAAKPIGEGSLMLRSMLSLEPATVTDRVYPLLFQTGEAAFGQPIVDGQHPHDLFMELSVQYARPVGETAMLNFYYAPIGDPALGPTAFPHRASAIEMPQAALSHHWQDSSHIANNVLTAGISLGRARIEVSGFHGMEPDEGRWNIDYGAMDSWSARFSLYPSSNWKAQVSAGRLNQPEPFHEDDVVRYTASLHNILPRGNGNSWATSFIWGRNYQTLAGESTNAFLAETVLPVGEKNFVTGRVEWGQRDELFADDHELEEHLEHEAGSLAFAVTALTAGYTRDVMTDGKFQVGVGANISGYWIEDALKPYYGKHPWGVTFFARIRLRERP